MIDFINTSPLNLLPSVLIAALLLDIAIGDPRWLPHPVRLIGRMISFVEFQLRRYLKRPLEERLGGILLVILITVPTFLITYGIYTFAVWLSYNVLAVLGLSLIVYLTSTTIAVRELISSARLVIESVKERSIDKARGNLSMIVGRDTENLSEKDILKATMETLAENLSDGVIAPVFYLVLGGLPLAMTYKAINTLDSMVGYRNNKYGYFGWAAARIDDMANYIPARITGLLIVISSFFVYRSVLIVNSSLVTMFRDGRKHLSPNSGIPEAAIAGALDVRLGGPSTYGGVIVERPFIGRGRCDDYLTASESAIGIAKVTATLGIGLAVALLFVRSML